LRKRSIRAALPRTPSSSANSQPAISRAGRTRSPHYTNSRAPPLATADECLAFIETHRLYGRGIGWSDVQLLVAARLSAARSGRWTRASPPQLST